MINYGVKIALITALASSAFAISTLAQSNSASAVSASSESGNFVKKRYSINGEWSIVEVEGETQIRFSEDFKTKGGPDLKVYLSKTPIDGLDSETASNDAQSIGVLKSKSGGQFYTVPADIKLSDFKSVIIHCEAFSVLWGGFDLPINITPKP